MNQAARPDQPPTGSLVSVVRTYEVSASDDRGVMRVEFWVNGALQQTDMTAPYSWSFNEPLPPTPYTVEAHVIDTAGQMTVVPLPGR